MRGLKSLLEKQQSTCLRVTAENRGLIPANHRATLEQKYAGNQEAPARADGTRGMGERGSRAPSHPGKAEDKAEWQAGRETLGSGSCTMCNIPTRAPDGALS